ncbi:MAG TPA: FAD-binding protein, partial [Firmicutes bacterium]|nr:FAD-binding protein [Bacillota bacterium]
CRTVSEVVAAGMLPLALEIMGQVDINLVEDYLHLGLPREAAALLLIELEGPGPSLDRQAQVIEAIARSHGGSGIKYASDEREREQLWLARKSAAGTYGRLKPTYITQDVTVPRPCIPALFETISELATEIGLPISILGHMGDGNLHPAVLFDDQDPEERERTLRAGEAIVEAALRLGGSLTGEHGVGVEKLPFLPQAYPAPTLRYFAAIKRAFDPQGLLNPGKAIISPWPLPPAPTPSEAREVQPDAVLAELEGWLGDNLVSDPSRIASLGFPPDHMPEAVAFPADRIQLAETVRLLADSRIPIWPVGSASLLHTAFRPFRGGVAVSTARLQRVIDLDPENLTLTVEAGIPASTLNGLAKLDLHYPVDPWRTPTSTLGGEVATDAFGPSHLTYGTTRDQLLGMTFVDAQGEECVVGGRTIKNVTGYDVTRLLCGSWGTLGIVTSVTVRLWPRPEQEITCAIPLVGEKDTLSGFVQDVWRHLRPAALQLLSPLPSTPGHREWWKTWTLFVRLAGMEEDVRTWQEKLAGLVLSYRLPDLIVLPEQEAGEAWDTVRRCSGLAVRRRQAATRAGLTVCGRQAQRVGYLRVPRSASLPASFRLLAWARDRGDLPLVTCHWGLGLVDFVLSTPETRSDEPEDLPALAACFHAHLGWYGCSPAQRNEEGVAPPKGILRLIKQEVDRAGVLAPAAFILASAPDPAAGRE